MTKIRDANNYPGKEFSYETALARKLVTLYGLPVRLFKYGEKETISFEVWKSKSAFENGESSEPNWMRSFEVTSDFKNRFSELFINMEDSAFAFLGVEKADFNISFLDINLFNLTIRSQATGISKPNKTVSDGTSTIEEFVAIKIQYPDLTEGFAELAWTIAQEQDEELAKFN